MSFHCLMTGRPLNGPLDGGDIVLGSVGRVYCRYLDGDHPRRTREKDL